MARRGSSEAPLALAISLCGARARAGIKHIHAPFARVHALSTLTQHHALWRRGLRLGLPSLPALRIPRPSRLADGSFGAGGDRMH